MFLLGVDIIEYSQIEKPLVKYGQRFKELVYTNREITICEKRKNSTAAYAERFALKEAAMKAFGTGAANGIYWNQIEYLGKNHKSLIFSGNSKSFIDHNKITNISFSISNTESFSIAVVVLSS